MQFRHFESEDFIYYLKNWSEDFERFGIIDGFKKTNANYNMPYLYILAVLSKIPLSSLIKIKVVSIVFDFIMAIFSYKIVCKVTKEHKFNKTLSVLAFAAVFMNPTTIMKSSVWGQCDAIYVTFILISMYYIFEKKYVKAFIYFGVSFTFKLQAIFVLPLYLIIYIKNREFSIKNFFIIPLIHVISFLPAFFMGRPISDLWKVYFGQIGEYKSLTMNFPNIYCFLPNQYELFSRAGIIFDIMCVGIIMFFAIYNKEKLNNEQIIELAMVLLLVETYFLPAIHERYLFCADILSIIYIFIKRKNILSAMGIIIVSISTYFTYLFHSEIFQLKTAAIIQLIIMIIFIIEFTINEKENIWKRLIG